MRYRDISISFIPLVSESVPLRWFDDRNKNPHFVLLYMWLLLGATLAHAYKSNLLASLVKVEYEKPPETFQVIDEQKSLKHIAQYSACTMLLQDLLDRKLEIYINAGTVIVQLMRDSPFEVHRRAFHEGVEKRGGYSTSAIMPTHLMRRLIEGKAVGVAPDDSMAPYQHVGQVGKEVLTTGFTGFYYPVKMPLMKELNRGIQHLFESGISEQVNPGLRGHLDYLTTIPSNIMHLTINWGYISNTVELRYNNMFGQRLRHCYSGSYCYSGSHLLANIAFGQH